LLALSCLAPAQEQGPKVTLSLEKAMEIALAPDGSTRLQLAAELVKQAEARRLLARGYLLPNVDGYWSYQSFTRNLEAFGVKFGPVAGLSTPTFVGPIDNFDRRLSASTTLVDLSALKRYQAAKSTVSAAREDVAAARNQAAAAVAKAYLAAVQADESLAAATANVELAERTLRLSQSQKSAGTGTGLEVTRSEVLLAGERQKATQAKEDRAAARLQLMRAMNINFGPEIELTSGMKYSPADIPAVADAVQFARGHRPELRAQREREHAASLNYTAAKWERLPSASAFGDYGNLGTEFTKGRATRTVGVQVRIPIYDGGRRDARREEGASLLRQEQIRTRDTAQQVELEVRLALEALLSTESQVKVALEGLALAEKELAQAERRYAAGVAPGLEVTDAQTRLARARENQVLATFRQSAARIDYGLAVGALETAFQ
jgi:outer membrane protein TolC